jgi:methylmalonyl-CoA/ethylmalonyl-CoA epimerase
MRLHHIGWAVRSISDNRAHFEEQIGLPFDGIEEFPRLSVAFYDVGGCLLELLEATSPEEDDVSRFIERRGEGIHHLAYEVPDVAAALAEAERRGLPLIDRVPRPGARGTMIGFADPGREDGVFLEFVELPGGPNAIT